MKIIDLLNKIANGEEVPKIIIYRDTSYIYNSSVGDYNPDLGEPLFAKLYSKEKTELFINDEVIEIIEENKKITKLAYIEENTFSKRQNGMTSEDRRLLDSNFRELAKKINEIIDEVNKKEEK